MSEWKWKMYILSWNRDMSWTTSAPDSDAFPNLHSSLHLPALIINKHTPSQASAFRICQDVFYKPISYPFFVFQFLSNSITTLFLSTVFSWQIYRENLHILWIKWVSLGKPINPVRMYL